MRTNSYDTIVIGDDLAGLVAAALCAKRGLRVLVLTETPRPLSYQLGPHRLPVVPLVLGNRNSPAVRRVFDELGLEHAIKRKLRSESPSMQLIGPDIRLEIGSDDARVLAELARERPSLPRSAAQALLDSSVVAALFDAPLADNAFPPSGFWSKREIGRETERAAEDGRAWLAALEDPALRALASLPAAIAASADPRALSPAAVARGFHGWRHDAARLPGDWHTLRELLVDKLTHAGGELGTGKVEELTFGWGKVSGVRLASGDELGAGHVIAAMPLADLAPLLERKQPKRVAPLLCQLEATAYRYVLNLVVDEAGVPEGMGRVVLVVVDPAAPLLAPNAFAVHVDEPDDEARVVVTLTAACPVPAEANAKQLAQAFAALRPALMANLEEVMPFVGRHLLLAHSPVEAAPPQGSATAAPPGLLARPEPLWSWSRDSAMGVGAAPYSLGIKQLTLCSSQIVPGLALEGVLAVGHGAARSASAGAVKKKDLLKDEVIAGGA